MSGFWPALQPHLLSPGFLFAYQDFSETIQKTKGRVFHLVG